jgi:CHAD domain-containing protein
MKAEPDPRAPIGRYAHQLAAARLDRFSRQAERALERGDDEDVHDLRTSIRRFEQALSVFGEFFDATAVKKARKRVRKIMKQAGEVRNIDITVDLLRESGIPVTSVVFKELESTRRSGLKHLHLQLEDLEERDRVSKWRALLEIETALEKPA